MPIIQLNLSYQHDNMQARVEEVPAKYRGIQGGAPVFSQHPTSFSVDDTQQDSF